MQINRPRLKYNQLSLCAYFVLLAHLKVGKNKPHQTNATASIHYLFSYSNLEMTHLINVFLIFLQSLWKLLILRWETNLCSPFLVFEIGN